MSNLIIPVYKGKVLLYSQDIFFQEIDNNVWNLFSESVLKKIKISKLDEQKIAPSLNLVKLTDKQVNSIARQNGIRVEFYRFDEIKKLNLSDDASVAFTQYIEKIQEMM